MSHSLCGYSPYGLRLREAASSLKLRSEFRARDRAKRNPSLTFISHNQTEPRGATPRILLNREEDSAIFSSDPSLVGQKTRLTRQLGAVV